MVGSCGLALARLQLMNFGGYVMYIYTICCMETCGDMLHGSLPFRVNEVGSWSEVLDGAKLFSILHTLASRWLSRFSRGPGPLHPRPWS